LLDNSGVLFIDCGLVGAVGILGSQAQTLTTKRTLSDQDEGGPVGRERGRVVVSGHVDVVQINWGKGTQTRLAQVYALPDSVKVDGAHDYDDVIRRPYVDRESSSLLEPDRDPRRFVEQLHTVMNGSYLVATELHDDDVCLFQDQDPVELQPPRTVKR